MSARGELLLLVISVSDCVTKSKCDDVYGCCHSLPDGIIRATDVMAGGKLVLICRYGGMGKGSAFAMRGAGARVMTAEYNPTCALQAYMDCRPRVDRARGGYLRHNCFADNFKIIGLSTCRR